MREMRDCAQCLRPFTPILDDQRFCCRPCAKKYDLTVNRIKDDTGRAIPRLCIVCKTEWFIPRNAAHKMCSPECRKQEVRSVAYAYWVAHKQKPRKESGDLACSRCEHWKKRPDSDNGGECVIGRWMVCKPYLSTAKPFKEKTRDAEESDKQA